MLSHNGGIDLTPRHEPFDLAEQTRIDYAREWGRAHGLLPDLPPSLPPRYPVRFPALNSTPGLHLCPVIGDWIEGDREACPHCKIAAPSLRALDAGPGIE